MGYVIAAVVVGVMVYMAYKYWFKAAEAPVEECKDCPADDADNPAGM